MGVPIHIPILAALILLYPPRDYTPYTQTPEWVVTTLVIPDRPDLPEHTWIKPFISLSPVGIGWAGVFFKPLILPVLPPPPPPPPQLLEPQIPPLLPP